MRAWKRVVGGFLGWAALSACGMSVTVNDSSSSQSWTMGDDAWSRSNDLQVSATRMRGDLGDIRGFEQEATRVASIHFPGYSTVDLTGEGAEGAVMLALSVTGGLANPELQPGAENTYGDDAAQGETDIDVLGCSGPEVDDWQYDEHADEVTVLIAALPSGGRRMNLTATWKDRETGAPLHVVKSSFDYVVPADGSR